VKIIISLRNPVARAFSQYKYNVRRGLEDLSFMEALEKKLTADRLTPNRGFDYIGYGMYYEQVKAYMDNFEDVYILTLDEFKKDPQGEIMQILKFLDLAVNNVEFTRLPLRNRANPSGIPKNQQIVDFLQHENRFKNILKKIVPHFLISFFRKIKSQAMKVFLRDIRISEKDYKYLLDLYKQDITKLDRLIPNDLSDWYDS
jgi:hypothetical protein